MVTTQGKTRAGVVEMLRLNDSAEPKRGVRGGWVDINNVENIPREVFARYEAIYFKRGRV